MKRITVSKVVQAFICLLIVFLILFPFAWLVISTFKLQKDIIKWPPTFWPKTWTFDNYVDVFDRIPMARYISNTVIFAGAVSLFSAFFDSLAGYAFAKLEFRGKEVLFNIVLLTMLVPFQIIMIPLYIELHIVGILNTFVGLILPRITSAYGIYFMRSFFTGLPKELQEAARIDGMGEFGIFWRIMLPLCKPAFLTFFIFCLTSNWNDLLYPDDDDELLRHAHPACRSRHVCGRGRARNRSRPGRRAHLHAAAARAVLRGAEILCGGHRRLRHEGLRAALLNAAPCGKTVKGAQPCQETMWDWKKS